MYKIVGADRREYGPIAADQLREWIAQGRANAQTIARFEEGPWKPLSTFPEFADLFSAAAPPPPSQPAGAAGPPPLSGQAPQTIYLPSAPPQSNSMAVAGLVFGILGLLCCPVIAAVLAIIFSAIGLNQINQHPERYKTDKLVAIIGLVLGVLGLIFWSTRFFIGFRPGRTRWFRRF